MRKVSRELEEEIGMRGPEDDTCILVFWSKGKIVQYASVENRTFDYKRVPNILTHEVANINTTFALGPVCINRKKTEHTYQ